MNGHFSTNGVLTAAFGLIVALAAGAPRAAAQRAGPGTWRAGGAVSVERVIRLADELELSGTQREALESIRLEMLEMRISRTSEQMTLISEIQAGMREREAMRQEIAQSMRTARETLGGTRERLQEILTEEQSDEFRQLSRRVARSNRGAWGRGDARGRGGAWGRGDARDRGDAWGRGGAWRDRGGPDRERFERARTSRDRQDTDRGRGRVDQRTPSQGPGEVQQGG